MDGFDTGVDGFYSVENQLHGYLRRRADRHFEATREEKRAIDSREAFEARQERIREDFLDGIGGLPDRPDDLSVEVTGTLERDGYAVENVVFESLPDFHVTANCYVPGDEGPHPALLFTCGHVEEAKVDPENQKTCIDLARNGFVVLAVDPLCQGERLQYTDPETGESIVRGAGGVFAHCYAGQQCYYAGANLARWMIHDDRRALDYLHDRADVDEDRVGAVGTSGGGMQVIYLALVEDRLDAAVPCCYVTDRRAWYATGKPQDAEQNVYGAIARGIDDDDLLAGMAPHPVCIGAAQSDEYVPIDGTHDAYERLRRVWDLYDASEDVELNVTDTVHASVWELRDGIFEWICEQLGDAPYEPTDPEPLPAAKLRCTPDGSVRGAYEDERTIPDLVGEYVAESDPEARTGSTVEDPGTDAERIRETVTERFDLDRDGCDLHRRITAENEEDGLTVERVFFQTERNPDVVVAGVLASDPEVAPDDATPAVVCYEEGTRELPERSDDLAALAREYGVAFAFDPRGTGAVRPRDAIPAWIDDFHALYGTEANLANRALLLERSPFGDRVYDVGRAVEFLRAETGSDSVALVGEGVGAYHALYAGAVDPGVETLELRDLGPGFREMATSYEYPYDPRLLAVDVVGDCDVPRVLAALRADEREVRVDP